MRRYFKRFLVVVPLLVASTFALGRPEASPAHFVRLPGGSVAFFYPEDGVRAEFHLRIKNTGGEEGTPRCWIYFPDGSRKLLRVTGGVPVPAGTTSWIDGEISIPERFHAASNLEDVEEDCSQQTQA